MGIDKEILKRIAGAYIGCGVSRCIEYHQTHKSRKSKQLIYELTPARVHLFCERSAGCYTQKEVVDKLLLYRLCNLTEKETDTIAIMLRMSLPRHQVRRMTDAIFLEDEDFQFQISHNGYCCMRKAGVLYNLDTRGIIDFLRAASFDAGYAHIRSLIDEGVALEKLPADI